MRIKTIELLKAAYGEYAIGAYNVCNMEQILGLFRGAREADAPIIVQFSLAARRYATPEMLEMMIQAARRLYPEVVFAVHLDHGDEKNCYDAIASGYYDSVMIDASHLPFAENVAVTRRVVEKAHERGIPVEAELGVLKGVEDDMEVSEEEALLTDPDQARAFVEQTGCDSLAVAIGTSHGAYKFKGSQRLHFDRLQAISERLPGLPLVLHGSSSVPAEEVMRINAAGGQIDASASGVREEEIRRAVQYGVTKVNIGTDGRLIWTRVHREFFRDRPSQFDFAIPGKEYMDAYAQFVAQKSRKLGCAGRGARLRETLKS